MIQLSENAARKITDLRKEEGRPESDFLRVRVKKGGCSGMSYKLDFDTVAQPEDKIYDIQGTKIAIDSQSLLYVLGMMLDFESGLNGKGFIFSNPNATKTCGCGTSFAV